MKMIRKSTILLSTVVISIIFTGCPNRQLTPEMERISSVSDTTNCKFIKSMYTETQSYNMIKYVQLNTSNAGGDSYKIITATDEMVMGVNIRKVNFEVYKCK